MSTNSPQQTSSSVSEMTLLVEQPDLSPQEVFLQQGISLGRAESNTVCVEDAAVEAIHARVWRQPDGTMLLKCESRDGRVLVGDGVLVAELVLAPGTQFRLGAATISCQQRQTRTTMVVVTNNPWEVRCPRCAGSLVGASRDLKECPHCQLALVYFASAPAKDGGRPGFSGWLPWKIGPYRVRGFVAEGGMGIVLQALHVETKLPAALKLLRGDLADDRVGQARFAMEINTLKPLKHPHVVRLQDAGRDGHLAWLAMDWVQGKSLAGKIGAAKKESRLLSLDDIRKWLQQICAGLAYLHQQRLIHRDLKPGNILVAKDGVVRITDLGIAKPAGNPAVTTMMTRTGAVMGTSGYMAPEQGEGQALTPACDVYSLGVIWYEMLTGRLPPVGRLRWEEVRPDCPPAWRTMVEACLSAAPQERPVVVEVAATLDRQPRKSTRRRAAIFMVAAAVALVTLAIIVANYFMSTKSSTPLSPPGNVAQKQASAEDADPKTTTPPFPSGNPSQFDHRELTLDLGNGVSMKLVLIPAGKFTMGSPETEKDREPNEVQHEVTLSKPFYMGVTHVTVDQYAAFVKDSGQKPDEPSFKQSGDHPVVNVDWYDTQAFCKWLSRKTGRTVVLPTEAQWEYACRAGSTTAFCFGDDEKDLGQYAWYDKNSDCKTHPVAQKKPNAWGLYDMHGNACQWCQDSYGDYDKGAATDPKGADAGSPRVLRGGSWYYLPWLCRAAHRHRGYPDIRLVNLGFRVAVLAAGVD